ncbi:hypothetical protein HNY73_010567 [Argiope bruennichi]|uniref:Uncharacterized protein n=1 Tax=Argiope bruennichi TaxID=94029 RepID=A0A8T0F2A5_ARGBR|nr:hypothetical protein HNY73_010567 [Argiope bruennichi]
MPLMESCLPEEVLVAWERKHSIETDAKGSRSLEHLMTFFRLQVQGDEMMQLAKSGFGTNIRKRDPPTERIKPNDLMTASALQIGLKEIRQLTEVQSWKYVPGNMNLLSCGYSPRQMLNSKWWEGPSWLKQNAEHWPDGEISCEPREVNVGRKKTRNVNVDLANDAPPLLICNVSDYDKMIKVFAWVLRFVK